MMSARPAMDAHSPEPLRKARLMSLSDFRSSVLPDSLLAWKRRSMPFPSYTEVLVPNSLSIAGGKAYLCGQCHASRYKETALFNPSCHHTELGLLGEVDEIFYFGLQRDFLEVGLLVGIRGFGASVGIAVSLRI
jgi:hypothetical protein